MFRANNFSNFMILDFPTENLPHTNIVPGIDYLSINFGWIFLMNVM